MTDQTTIFSQDKLLEMYEALPQQLKDAIFSVDVADKIMKTGQKFGLNVEQIGLLAEATGLVMLGALHPRSYIQKLEETLKIERAKAIDVAKEVNHEIFFPVREQLKKLHGMEDTEEVTGERTTERGDLLKKLAELKQRTTYSVQRTEKKEVPPVQEQKPVSAPAPAIPSMQKIPSPLPPPAPAAPKMSEQRPASSAERAEKTKTPSAPRVSRALQEQFAPKAPEQRTAYSVQRTEKKEAPSAPSLPAATAQKIAEQKPAPAAPKLEALQNEIQNLLKNKTPQSTPKAPEPREIPEWAKQKIETSDKRHATSTEQELKEQLPGNLPIAQTQQRSVQKVPMQEIRPRPAGQNSELRTQNLEKQRLGPGGDRYREPIE